MSHTVGRRAGGIAVRLALARACGRVARCASGRASRRRWNRGRIALAVLVSTSLRGLLFGISPVDPLAYGNGRLVVGASLRRCTPGSAASRVDPAAALRQD